MTCPDYFGVTCTNGNCPKALHEEHPELDIEVCDNCRQCPYNEGCIDCIYPCILDITDEECQIQHSVYLVD